MVNLKVQRCNDALQADLQRIQDHAAAVEPGVPPASSRRKGAEGGIESVHRIQGLDEGRCPIRLRHIHQYGYYTGYKSQTSRRPAFMKSNRSLVTVPIT